MTENEAHRRALVLLSGGIDSTTLLAVARSEGFQPVALVFRYGQRHAIEVERALEIARAAAVEARVVEIDLRSVGGSALTSDAIDVPRDRPEEEIGASGIPPTYVPARNTVFLAYALAWAEALGISDIYIGVNALDYSGYPDCRPEYIEAFERMANLASKAATEGGLRVAIHAPLIRKTKAEIVRCGAGLGVDYSRTWSCYDPVRERGGRLAACGRCDSCLLRKKGFREARVPDPTVYAVETGSAEEAGRRGGGE
jgi:7-cyano-7-deazaguanine synthase